MRTALIFGYVANLLLSGVALWLSPDRVAIHFGSGGEPNGWAPSYVNALIMGGVNTLLFLALFFTPRLIAGMPVRWISLPHKDYWLNDENRPATVALLSEQQYRFGTAMFAFLFLVGGLTLAANLSTPVRLREDIFWWAFGLIMTYTAYWTIRLMWKFRLPKEARSEQAREQKETKR